MWRFLGREGDWFVDGMTRMSLDTIVSGVDE